MPPSRKKLPALAAGLALVATGLAVAPATTAAAAGPGLVISEVYGGGGNVGATLNADYVELYNSSTNPVDLSALTLQYRSSGGTGAATGIAALTGTVPAGEHFLIATSPTTDPDGAPLPVAPDLTVTGVNMAATAGTVYVSTSSTPLTLPTGSITGNAQVVDLVGFGGTNTSETAPTGVISTSTTAKRNASGADTDKNNVDLTVSAPDPENCDCAAPPPTTTFEVATIAEIQGTGFSSAYAAQPDTYVTTEGVVTAVYGATGYHSYVIQTEGTGDPTDETPGASDGIPVQQGSGPIDVEIGDFIEVTGPVIEEFGVTKITWDPSDADSGLNDLSATPHTDPTPLTTDYPATGAGREAHESELLDVGGQPFTVTETFPMNQYAEIGLATGDRPLVQPTEVADAQDAAAIQAVKDENYARGVVLDDGADINYVSNTYENDPLPWLSPTNPVRVGAAADVTGPVILDYQFGAWRFQPTERVTDEGADVATFENTRLENLAPQEVGGDLKLATFNVLNYFNTTGVDWVASGNTCSFYKDKDGDPVTNNTCSGNGPRGAAEGEDLTRQQAKIVTAINTLDADIVSLEEIENSVTLGEDRDDALQALVAALNADAGTTRWAFPPSPAAEDLPPTADQDVIRNAFIYNPGKVDTVGASEVLVGSAAFDNAREPLAQAFKAEGDSDADAFGVIVNHFKSKSASGASGDNLDTGQGGFNGDRTRQAAALVEFAESFEADRGISKMFLTGDFNSYSMEDPIQVLETAGYTNLKSDFGEEYSYNFDGLDGSLDHVMANEAALPDVTLVDVWRINSPESIAFEYSRHNYNVTDFYEENVFRASDHDPEIVGIDVPGYPVDPPDEPAATTVTATGGEFGYDEDIVIPVDVDSANPTTGTVEIRDGDTLLGSATVATDGTATVSINGGKLEVGTYTLTVRYSGDANNNPSTGSVEVSVVKVTPTMKVVKDKARGKKGTTVRFTVELSARGQDVTGKVRVKRKGSTWTEQLKNERARFKLGPFKKAGTYKFTITYLGSDLAKKVTKKVEIKIRKSKKH